MADKDLVRSDEREAGAVRNQALRYINDRYGVTDNVRVMRTLMVKVTEKDITAETVNAACNCVSSINETLRTAIAAARFLSDK